jgi:FAD/FMN-containing dehydrogenase
MSTFLQPRPSVEPSRRAREAGAPIVLNDLHSRLNPTTVAGVVSVHREDDIQRAIAAAEREDRVVCVGGGRHAMGAQQFATDGIYLDMRGYGAVRGFDAERGLIEVEAGIQWPELIAYLQLHQRGRPHQWGIRQKQTGADRLSIGGAVAANIHGRGLTLPPFVGDVESLTVVDPSGALVRCSRTERPELFSLVVGGYGLFGIVSTVTLRLAPRHKVRRTVEIETADRLIARFDDRIAEGYTFGDFQFAIDPRSPDFLRKGIFSCYRPEADDAPIPENQRSLAPADWERLLYLAHVDKARAWDAYASHYLATSGQVYWSDTHQLSTYLDDYHIAFDRKTCAAHPGTEVITELYVPRAELADFLGECADDLREHDVSVIYGTIRLIERDDESFLPWAREPWACTILNLHTEHAPLGLVQSASAFRRLIDIATRRGGSYYLTYHKHATRAQVERCHPRFAELLRLKRRYDPGERLQSDWYRHYRG